MPCYGDLAAIAQRDHKWCCVRMRGEGFEPSDPYGSGS